MADGTQMHIEDVHVDPKTGHISIHVKSVTTQGSNSWEGPTRLYGVDAAGFQARFGGDLQHFLAWVKSQHQGYCGAHQSLVAELEKLKGAVI